jgi:hypothetical protein
LYDLERFIEASFNAYRRLPREGFTATRDLHQFLSLFDDRPNSAACVQAPNPYSTLGSHHLWKTGVTEMSKGDVNPLWD